MNINTINEYAENVLFFVSCVFQLPRAQLDAHLKTKKNKNLKLHLQLFPLLQAIHWNQGSELGEQVETINCQISALKVTQSDTGTQQSLSKCQSAKAKHIHENSCFESKQWWSVVKRRGADSSCSCWTLQCMKCTCMLMCAVPCTRYHRRTVGRYCCWQGHRINLGNVASFRRCSYSDSLNEMQTSHLGFKTFNFQLLLGAQFRREGSMQNEWKIANVIYIKVRLEETNYASDSRQYS